jgi:hypothetical protein
MPREDVDVIRKAVEKVNMVRVGSSENIYTTGGQANVANATNPSTSLHLNARPLR